MSYIKVTSGEGGKSGANTVSYNVKWLEALKHFSDRSLAYHAFFEDNVRRKGYNLFAFNTVPKFISYDVTVSYPPGVDGVLVEPDFGKRPSRVVQCLIETELDTDRLNEVPISVDKLADVDARKFKPSLIDRLYQVEATFRPSIIDTMSRVNTVGKNIFIDSYTYADRLDYFAFIEEMREALRRNVFDIFVEDNTDTFRRDTFPVADIRQEQGYVLRDLRAHVESMNWIEKSSVVPSIIDNEVTSRGKLREIFGSLMSDFTFTSRIVVKPTMLDEKLSSKICRDSLSTFIEDSFVSRRNDEWESMLHQQELFGAYAMLTDLPFLQLAKKSQTTPALFDDHHSADKVSDFLTTLASIQEFSRVRELDTTLPLDKWFTKISVSDALVQLQDHVKRIVPIHPTILKEDSRGSKLNLNNGMVDESVQFNRFDIRPTMVSEPNTGTKYQWFNAIRDEEAKLSRFYPRDTMMDKYALMQKIGDRLALMTDPTLAGRFYPRDTMMSKLDLGTHGDIANTMMQPFELFQRSEIRGTVVEPLTKGKRDMVFNSLLEKMNSSEAYGKNALINMFDYVNRIEDRDAMVVEMAIFDDTGIPTDVPEYELFRKISDYGALVEHSAEFMKLGFDGHITDGHALFTKLGFDALITGESSGTRYNRKPAIRLTRPEQGTRFNVKPSFIQRAEVAHRRSRKDATIIKENSATRQSRKDATLLQPSTQALRDNVKRGTVIQAETTTMNRRKPALLQKIEGSTRINTKSGTIAADKLMAMRHVYKPANIVDNITDGKRKNNKPGMIIDNKGNSSLLEEDKKIWLIMGKMLPDWSPWNWKKTRG